MSSKIKRIDFIKNMAVFQDFPWASSVRDKGNNIVEFKEINIFYGRNYSGKTTLSRIIRALETGSISEKYDSPEFQLSFDDGSKVTQDSLSSHGQIVRVFNEDFVKDNLHFISDENQKIKSFAILGEDNAQLEEEIQKHETELGKEENQTGLARKLLEAERNFNYAQKAHDNRSSGLEGKLRDKANKRGTGIKHNAAFGDATYNVIKIKRDITKVTKDSYTQLTNEQVEKYHYLLKDEPKKEITESKLFNLKYSMIASISKELIERKIQVSDPIQELLNDAALSAWVRAGRERHKDKRDKCAFCGNDLPPDLWEKLDKHFNQESEKLRTALDRVLADIETEHDKARVPTLLKIKTSDFYSNFTKDLDTLTEKLSTHSSAYRANLEVIKEQIEKRKDDIFIPLLFDEPESVEDDLNAVRDLFEKIRNKSNQFTASLNTEQSKACAALLLHEVFTFRNDIKYADELKAIEELGEARDKTAISRTAAQKEVSTKKAKIDELKAKLKDEGKGADQVNDYLNNYFGHQSLSLKAIEETSEDAPSGYRFEVIRKDEKASQLSEGECSLIAFCYFMAKLEDIDTKGNQPIIWIDDPVSSLDSNHIFFVYSLINSVIVKSKNFLQLFISTHNLDFLKYLKRISGDYKGKDSKHVKIREFFLVECSGDSSRICLMPGYLKNYVTEFNYLFHQIYRCATAKSIDDENYYEFYNFGNNARKFLEIYLYYRYPNGIYSDDRLSRFFGKDSIAKIFIDRINNEYSHLGGGLERGALPIDVPEMKIVACQIIAKIKEDKEQYKALLKSINKTE